MFFVVVVVVLQLKNFLDCTEWLPHRFLLYLIVGLTAIHCTPQLDPERAGDLSRCAGRSLVLSHRSLKPGQHVLTPHTISLEP